MDSPTREEPMRLRSKVAKSAVEAIITVPMISIRNESL